MPSSLKNILSKENIQLAKDIVINGGLLISEYFENIEISNKFSLNLFSKRYIDRDKLQALFSDFVCLSASYSQKNSFVNGKKTNKDSSFRHALEKALKWEILRGAIHGDDEIFKDEMFNLNKEIIKNEASAVNINNISDVLKNLKNKKDKEKSGVLPF